MLSAAESHDLEQKRKEVRCFFGVNGRERDLGGAACVVDVIDVTTHSDREHEIVSEWPLRTGVACEYAGGASAWMAHVIINCDSEHHIETGKLSDVEMTCSDPSIRAV